MPFYISTDAGAPLHNTTVGSLIRLFRACLVNGYGSKPGAGWEEVFTGVNVAVFRATGGDRRHYLYVDDTVASLAYVRGYISMSGATDDGVEPYPDKIQSPSGEYWYKGSVANIGARPWMIIADDKFFYYIIDYTTLNSVIFTGIYCRGYAFGEFPSFIPGDQYNSLLLGDHGTCQFGYLQGLNTSTGNVYQYISRNYGQVIGSSICYKVPKEGYIGIGNNNNLVSGYFYSYNSSYPPAKLRCVSPVYVGEWGMIRGILPGFWVPWFRYDTYTSGSIFTGTYGSEVYGRNLFTVRVQSSQFGLVLMEITPETWYNGSFSLAGGITNFGSNLNNSLFIHADYTNTFNGYVKDKSNNPLSNCPLGLIHRDSMTLVAKTISDVDGNYSFTNLKSLNDYFVVCLDPTLTYDALIYDHVTPA